MMHLRSIRLALMLAGALCLVLAGRPAAAAPPHGKGKGASQSQGNGKGQDNNGKGQGNSASQGNGQGNSSQGYGPDDNDLRRAGITLSIARDYAVQYGVTGYESLPPGIRQNLARGKPLPPGIAKKTVPPDMLARLPVYPGYEWRVVGSDLVLVAIATALVADVLFDVFD